jgi:TRAP-type C4-dicarboxylate transport system permease small subunit
VLRTLLVRLDDGLGRAEDLFLSASHGVIATLIVVAVLFRYVLSDPLTWSEEFIVALFGWMLFIGMAASFRARANICLDLVVIIASGAVRRALGALSVLATMATLTALLWFGIEHALLMAGSLTPMLQVSMSYAAAALPVGAALALVHVLRNAVEHGVGQALWPETGDIDGTGNAR